jgi:hypothetical protein
MTGAKVAGALHMESANIGGDVSLGAEFKDITLSGIHVRGQFDMTGAKVAGALEISLADIGGSLTMTGAKVAGTLSMDSTNIRGELFMDDPAEFEDVSLSNAQIGGKLLLIGTKVTGSVYMQSVSIGSHLLMLQGSFSKPITLIFAEIGGSLDLRSATLAALDLTGARIGGELHLASGGQLPIWNDRARLVLRNTHAAAVQDDPCAWPKDLPCAWPKDLDLDGFSYERLGGLGADPEAAIVQRGSQWFVDWLARDQPYTPQPYEQAAKVLREMGHLETANDLLYAERERERDEAWQHGDKARWFGLSLLKWTIGYGIGHRYFWALYWVVGLVLLATIVLRVTGQGNPRRWGDERIGVWYSFDILLPIIQLRKAHYDIDLEGFARYWFYFHKIMGYVLASFLIAGLAGLTA